MLVAMPMCQEVATHLPRTQHPVGMILLLGVGDTVDGDKGLGAVTEVCGTGLFDVDRGSRVSSEACGRSSALGGRGSGLGGGSNSEAFGRIQSLVWL